MRSPLTVFLCSTYSDLSDEREAVLDAIRRLQLQHDSMEFFGARAGQPIETCLREVRQRILVVIDIRGDNVQILPKHMERDPDRLRLLEAWKKTLQERHTVAEFQQSHDLAVQVAADLGRAISELEEAAHAREEARAESPVRFLMKSQS